MKTDLIARLKPWVTTFSESILLKNKHSDEVYVGGEIVNIFNIFEITKDENTCVQIDIDDKVGITTLLVPYKVFENFKELIKMGNMILATGKVYDPYNSLRKDKTASIICWNIELLESKENGK